jgi:CheY-like chemotaxis protein
MSPSATQPILIVEDSDDDFLFTIRAFRVNKAENPIRRCTNGDQALDYLFRRGEFAESASAPRPSLVLLDLNLPGTDGRQVLRRIKNSPELKQIPVVVLTTSKADHDVDWCYTEGANSYVRKPDDLPGYTRAIGLLSDYWFDISLLPNG